MIIVHHLNNSRSQRILWLLEELGLPYEIKRYQRKPDMMAPKELRAVHPLGKSPVITDGELVLAESGADIVEHLTGRKLRPYVDATTGETVTPTLPAALQHAIAIHVAAHFDDRAGDTNAAMATIVRLCAPYRVFAL